MKKCACDVLLILSWLVVIPQLLGAQVACARPWALEETLRVGSLEGADALNRVRGVEFDRTGNIYVAQQFLPWITVFDPKGKVLRRIGRAGEGPGEFAGAPEQIGWKGDTLWAVEGGVNHLFGNDGRQLAQLKFTAPVPNEASQFSAGVLLQDGSVLGYRTLTWRNGLSDFYDKRRFPILRFSRTGKVLDTIAVVGWTSDPYATYMNRSTSNAFVSHPAHPLQDWWPDWLPFVTTPDGGAIVFVDQPEALASLLSPSRLFNRLFGVKRVGSFDLLKIGIRGDTLLKRTIAFDPKPITASDQERLRGWFGRSVTGEFNDGKPLVQRDAAALERQRQAAMEAIVFPETFPPVRRIVAGHDGTFWLLREFRADQADLWEVYDRSGALLGSLLVPNGVTDRMPWSPHMTLLFATRSEVWGTTVDALGVPSLHRFRIPSSCP